jgi:hypothetical protein
MHCRPSSRRRQATLSHEAVHATLDSDASRDALTMLPRRVLVALLAACVAASACETAPSMGPTTAPGSVGPGASTPASAAPASSPAAAARLAEALRDAIDVSDILADLDRLESIAEDNQGNRAAGSAGHDASVEFVADELRDAGYQVELQPVELPAFIETGPTVIEIKAAGAPDFENIRDFKAMLFSASANVTTTVFALGFDPNAQPGDRNGTGCQAEDWTGVPAGVIVLVQPGRCRRLDVVVRAQAAGAVALVTTYADWQPGSLLRPTLIEPDDVHIPAIGATHAVGLALNQAAEDGSKVHLVTSAETKRVQSMNVIGETPGGDPNNILMLGGHLDSVIDGPGINDDGSGTMTVLEIAREVAALAAAPSGGPAWKVRVAFWTGEEIGLLGSAAYAEALGPARDGPIRAYLNFDMLGSPNGTRVVYDGSQTSRPPESSAIAGLFTSYLDAAGLAWETESIGAASDHYPIEQVGIPIGGLFSGANEIKSAEQAATFGGLANTPQDSCYHLACDMPSNIDR